MKPDVSRITRGWYINFFDSGRKRLFCSFFATLSGMRIGDRRSGILEPEELRHLPRHGFGPPTATKIFPPNEVPRPNGAFVGLGAKLFVAQGDHWVDARGSTRWYPHQPQQACAQRPHEVCSRAPRNFARISCVCRQSRVSRSNCFFPALVSL